MRFKRNALSIVEIEHEHETIVFNVRAYSQTKYSMNSGVFDEINQYISTLPENRQKCIFDIYKDIVKHFQTIREIDNASIEYLNKRTKDIYNFLDLKQLDRWLRMVSIVGIPPTSTDTISDDLEENRTYLAEDYRNLITFTVGSRMMLPIWGDVQGMMTSASKNGGKAREYACLRIIVNTPLWQLPANARLDLYIVATVDSKGGSNSALFAGHGSELLPDVLKAGAIVKRLVVAPLNVDLERGGLAKNVHGYIQSALKDYDVPGSKAKITTDAGGDSETGEDFSSLEKLRLKEKESAGTVEKYRAWIQLAGPVALAKAIDPSVPVEYVQECLNTNDKLEYIDLNECQLILAKWLVMFIMPALSIDIFDRMEISKTIMPALQALLIHWNFNEVAVLITAEKVKDLQAISPVSYSRITKNTMAQLAEAYPYTTSKASVNERQANVGYQSIEYVANMFCGVNWNLTVPPTVVSRSSTMRPRVSSYPTPGDISEQLALLTIKIWSLFDVTRFTNTNAKFA